MRVSNQRFIFFCQSFNLKVEIREETLCSLFAANVTPSSQFDRLLLSYASLAETLLLVALKLHFHESIPLLFFHFFFMPAYTYLNLCLCGCTANSSVVFPSKYESEEYLLRYLSLFAITCNVKNGSWPWGLLNVFLIDKMFFFFHVATCCATIFPHNDESKQVDVCV